MKKLILVFVLAAAICFITGTNVASAIVVTQSLGWWNEGDQGSTHQLWHFTPGHITYIPGDGYTAIPEEVNNPDPLNVLATISSIGGGWDGQSSIVSPFFIFVNLELPNYDILNPYKEIWVDIGNAVIAPGSIGLSASGHEIPSTSYFYQLLPGQGDAEFGVIIRPNPELEKISFTIPATNGPAVLDYIHVDTICIPEPATIVLLGIGALSLIRRKK